MDSITRSPFQIGDEVVVCDKQHVMLAEFYDGECPTCHSHNTVPFSRQSVETRILMSYAGVCPVCTVEMTALLRQYSVGGPFVGKCPKCNKYFSFDARWLKEQARGEKFRTRIRKVNAILGWVLGLLIVIIIGFSLAGVLQNDRFILYAENMVWPKTLLLFDRIPDFIVSKKISKGFWALNSLAAERTASLLIKGAAVLSLFGVGVQDICMALWRRSIKVLANSEELLKLFVYKTKLLLEWIKKWVGVFKDRFT